MSEQDHPAPQNIDAQAAAEPVVEVPAEPAPTSEPVPAVEPAHAAQPAPVAETVHESFPEQRISHRHPVRWHADILLDGHLICEGYVKEVTNHGATLFMEPNPQKVKTISLRIHVPPLDDRHPQHIVGVDGKIICTILDSEEQLFRCGIHFTRFKVESDIAFLTARLEK